MVRVLTYAIVLCVLLASSAEGQCGFGNLTASDIDDNGFGRPVASSGNIVVVGARWDDDSCGGCPMGDPQCCDAGAVYVYRFDGLGWVEEQKLIASDGAENDRFGDAIDVDGETIIVGAFSADLGFVENQGAAYIFRYDGTSWTEEQKLVASDGTFDDFFGGAVSVDGDVAVVAAESDDDAGSSSGSAYVFHYDSGKWIEEQKLTASDAEANDDFGASVSIDGDVIVVGAKHDDIMGSAYVFRYDGTDWIEEQKLTASDGSPGTVSGDNFGRLVEISSDAIAIGAPHDDDACGGCPPDNELCCNSGSAYLFRWNGDAWVEEQKLTASDAQAFDSFGLSLSLHGDILVVGARNDDDACGGCPPGESNCCDAGAVYRYDFNGETWTEEEKLIAPNPTQFGAFGVSVSLSESYFVVSSPGDASVSVFCTSQSRFLRGDVDANEVVNGLTDSLFLLSFQFVPGSAAPPCLSAADVDDNGTVSGLLDSLYLLNFQFIPGSPSPPPPYQSCGEDPTLDLLPCVVHPCP